MPSVGKVLSRTAAAAEGRKRELRMLGSGSELGSPRVHFIFGGVSSETDRLYDV
jgi:hypothetical protein